jgi:hypothetical protein
MRFRFAEPEAISLPTRRMLMPCWRATVPESVQSILDGKRFLLLMLAAYWQMFNASKKSWYGTSCEYRGSIAFDFTNIRDQWRNHPTRSETSA